MTNRTLSLTSRINWQSIHQTIMRERIKPYTTRRNIFVCYYISLNIIFLKWCRNIKLPKVCLNLDTITSLTQLTFNVLCWFYFIAHFVYLYLCTFRVRIKIIIIIWKRMRASFSDVNQRRYDRRVRERLVTDQIQPDIDPSDNLLFGWYKRKSEQMRSSSQYESWRSDPCSTFGNRIVQGAI